MLLNLVGHKETNKQLEINLKHFLYKYKYKFIAINLNYHHKDISKIWLDWYKPNTHIFLMCDIHSNWVATAE